MEVDKFSLATLPEVPLGVVPCRERKSLLVTAPGEIRLFDVFDQICAVSWHLPLHFGLSAPAVQSFTSGWTATLSCSLLLCPDAVVQVSSSASKRTTLFSPGLPPMRTSNPGSSARFCFVPSLAVAHSSQQ
jgi:hypothetical protein